MTGNRGRPLPPPRSLGGPPRAQSTVRDSTPRSSHHAASPSGEKGQDTSEYLNIAERWWRAHQPWLEECGYLLRARYRQDWIPSWERKGFFTKLRTYEDMIELPATSRRIDATRLSDGVPVHLHLVSERTSQEETKIMLRLTSRKIAEVPEAWDNHTIPVIEVMDVEDDPNLYVVVTPLVRGYNDPWLETMGEAVDFLGQILAGMKFMHAQGIAHRNPQFDGHAIVYNATGSYPEGFHPAMTKMNPCLSGEAFKWTRTEIPVTYYFADFRAAKRYRRGPTPHGSRRSERKLKWEDEETTMDYPLRWKRNFAPEYMTPERKCDPFKLDVYLLGAQISRHFLKVYRGFEWLEQLVDDMCQEDPKLRITAAEAYVRFLWLSASVSNSDLAENLITKRRRETPRRVVRKLKRKLHVQGLLKEIGTRVDFCLGNDSRSVEEWWLPLHSA